MREPVIQPIIGLEIHVQLTTRTKMFCGCPLKFAAEPNSLTCPVCLGLPGALPVMNRRAYEFAVKAGLALGCTPARFAKWDRKSYFYPDLPKNYQISQYDLPVSADGAFDIPSADGGTRRVGILRAHLEEDAGKNLHEGLDHTRVDLNRAGTPLLEIVTRPDLRDAEETYRFCVELQRLVQWLGISTADMQKGQMRFEPNVNLAITLDGMEYRTPICEIKNLNSFRSVRLAVAYEINRQAQAWRENHDYTLEKVGKQNFGWDDVREVTEFQRGKEESHDYRYFPEPDLPPVTLDDALLERLRGEIGELPLARQARLMKDYGLSEKDCEIIMADRATADLFDASVAAGASPRTLTKQFVGLWNHLASARGHSVGQLNLTPARTAELAKMVDEGALSAGAAMQVGEKMLATGESPADIAQSNGLIQQRDESAIAAWVEQAFTENPQAVADALGDNAKKAKAAPGFLRGCVMKLSQGKADPRRAGELIERKLAGLKGNGP